MRDRGAEIVERAFALTLDRGGMRRTWLPVDGAHNAICLAILTNDNPLKPTSACIVVRIAER